MPAAATKIETRRTDWTKLDGVPPYRIWTQFDGLRFFQRHEWKLEDGSIETEEWIPGTYKHVTGGKPIAS